MFETLPRPFGASDVGAGKLELASKRKIIERFAIQVGGILLCTARLYYFNFVGWHHDSRGFDPRIRTCLGKFETRKGTAMKKASDRQESRNSLGIVPPKAQITRGAGLQ